MEQPAVVFEDWERVLRDTVPAALRAGYREAVVKYRYWLREKGKSATAESFKEHLAWKKSYLPARKYEIRLQALRWYWEKGEKRGIQNSEFRIQKGEKPDSRPVAVRAYSRSGTINQQPGKAVQMMDIPPLAKADLGGPPWERRLVARIREKHLAWTTEKTYRHWARRLVGFCQESGFRSQDSEEGV